MFNKSKEGKQAWPQCVGEGGMCKKAALYGRAERAGTKKVISNACEVHKGDKHIFHEAFATKKGMQVETGGGGLANLKRFKGVKGNERK